MGNLRVAVCDDEPMDLVQTITLIQQYDTGKCFDIFSYTRAVDLLKIALENRSMLFYLILKWKHPMAMKLPRSLLCFQVRRLLFS